MKFLASLLMILNFLLVPPVDAEETPRFCTYQTFKWNVTLRSSVDHKTIRHLYDDLAPGEMDPVTGCTICEEDQETIDIPPLAPFRLCKVFAPVVRETLLRLVQAGEPVYEVIGYQVGRTRGELDASGNRTEFSNHSYGIALDINPKLNGLYDHCAEFGPNCRLIRGGSWRTEQPGTLTSKSPIVKAMKLAGFLWGGKIQGNQKDFMHFSPSGY